MIAKMHGDVAEAQRKIRGWSRKIRGWSRGSVWVELSAAQCEFFGISRLYRQ
jgi:hypothetical protein